MPFSYFFKLKKLISYICTVYYTKINNSDRVFDTTSVKDTSDGT